MSGSKHTGANLEQGAEDVLRLALELGADEVSVTVSLGVSTELQRRDGKVEKAQESRSLGADVELMVDGRFSSHGTSDLRPAALRAFLERAVAATSHLEPDLDRRLPDIEDMGSADADLDLEDPHYATHNPERRREMVEALEHASREALTSDPVRSITAYVWDGRSQHAIACSNGFRHQGASTSWGMASTVSLADVDGRIPEAWSSASARHLEDLPPIPHIVDDLVRNGRARLGSKAAPSGKYPMLLDARVVSRILNVMLTPLGGNAIYEQRSCMADKLGKQIASTAFSLRDEPLVRRGLGSRHHDGDGLPATPRTIVDNGMLQTFFLSVYDARRLGKQPTTGRASNLCIAPGRRTPDQIARGLGRVVRVDGFLGGNTNPVTGDFSFGVQGALLENGKVLHPVSEMNVSGNIFELMGGYQEAASDVWTWSAWRCPSLLFDNVQFSGS